LIDTHYAHSEKSQTIIG